MGFISDSAVNFVGAGMPWIVYVLLCISAVGTVWAVTVGKPAEGSLLHRLFHVLPLWVVLRVLGFVMGTMTMFQLGPEMFWSAETGGEVMNLQVISNRGTKVWPDGLPETFCSDHWRCRYAGKNNAVVSHGDVIELLKRIDATGLDFIKTEHLYDFDGRPGYSAAQGS